MIKRTTANSNLFFLPCGTLPENPSELIMHERLRELLNYLEEIFDQHQNLRHRFVEIATCGERVNLVNLSALSQRLTRGRARARNAESRSRFTGSLADASL